MEVAKTAFARTCLSCYDLAEHKAWFQFPSLIYNLS
jgi:hypothetical protein